VEGNLLNYNYVNSKVNLYEQCDVNTVCNEGNCYAQNTWFSQCLNYCPKGWSCQSNEMNLIIFNFVF